MTPTFRKFLYVILAVLMVVDFYLIFNVGNPNSFLRLLITDTAYDLSLTVAASLLIALISLSMVRDNDQNSIKKVLERNTDHIIKMKKKNRSNEEIADSFLKEFGAEKGLFHVLLKRRVQRYISKIS